MKPRRRALQNASKCIHWIPIRRSRLSHVAARYKMHQNASVGSLASGDREVVNFTQSHVKTKSKLTNLMKISQIEGYNGK